MRPMRGQVIVEELRDTGPLWTPDTNPREVRTHRGRVLALGPPARTAGGVEVPHEYRVGDVVQFHFTSLEEAATNTWNGQRAIWVPQQNVDAVIE